MRQKRTRPMVFKGRQLYPFFFDGAQGRRLLIRLGVFLFLLVSLLLFRPAWSDEAALETRLRPYIHNGGILIADGEKVLFGYRDQELFCPASTLKLATALLSLHKLGDSFRFKTEFYLSEQRDLTIKGYGDPFLISEEWEIITKRLREKQSLPRKLRELRLDPTSFSPNLHIPGRGHSRNPYDAANGALVANFNTAYVLVNKKGEISSAEPQTPLTPLARRMAGDLPAGRHRINMSRDPAQGLSYTAELIRSFLEKRGYSFSGQTVKGPVEPEDRLIYTHYNTHSLKEVIASMMLYSSNYMANQLLLTVGLAKRGEPANLEKGLVELRSFLIHELGLKASGFAIVEGSGLSRQNRITPRALLNILRSFYPYRHLLPRDEMAGALVKTGTLKGIYSLAGYREADQPLYFVIILNQKKNYRDRILSLILHEYRQASLF